MLASNLSAGNVCGTEESIATDLGLEMGRGLATRFLMIPRCREFFTFTLSFDCFSELSPFWCSPEGGRSSGRAAEVALPEVPDRANREDTRLRKIAAWDEE